MSRTFPVILAILLCVSGALAQKDKPKVLLGDSDAATTIQMSGDYHENGFFRSDLGKFSIAIPAFPTQILDEASEKAKAKGIDVARQFVWVFGRTLYTIYYDTPFDKDGNPSPLVYADMQIGTRKGILNRGATLLSEKPFKHGKIKGTEFRYVISNGVRYINRVFLVGDMGYQVVGGYADEKDEKSIIAVLGSFAPQKKSRR